MYTMYRLFLCAALAATWIGPSRASAAETFVFDDQHTLVMFAADHFGYSRVFGRFNEVTGEFTVDRETPASSSVEVNINAASLDTGVERRDQHLRSPDFFSVAEFPEIRFKSTKVSWGEGDELSVEGELTLLGVTQSVTIPMKLNKMAPNFQGDMVAGVSGRVVLERSDFGMTYLSPGVGNEIEIWLEIEGKKKA